MTVLTTDLILPNLPATSKKQVFQELSHHTVKLYDGDAETMLDCLLEREKIGSTGIGGGVAIPHIKIDGLDRMIGVLAQLDNAIQYDALDEQPVDLVFMLLAPSHIKSNLHLKMLAKISRFLRDPLNCAQLRSAVTTEDIQNIIDEWRNNQAA